MLRRTCRWFSDHVTAPTPCFALTCGYPGRSPCTQWRNAYKAEVRAFCRAGLTEPLGWQLRFTGADIPCHGFNSLHKKLAMQSVAATNQDAAFFRMRRAHPIGAITVTTMYQFTAGAIRIDSVKLARYILVLPGESNVTLLAEAFLHSAKRCFALFAALPADYMALGAYASVPIRLFISASIATGYGDCSFVDALLKHYALHGDPFYVCTFFRVHWRPSGARLQVTRRALQLLAQIEDISRQTPDPLPQ
jgi:hypothetical protein